MGSDSSECENESNATDCAFLNVQDASNNVTGLYSCDYKKIVGDEEEEEDEEEEDEMFVKSKDQQSVYVYVKDTNHLIAPDDGGRVWSYQTVLEFEDFIIGCRPSHPQVSVTIETAYDPNPKIPFNPDRITYDPKVGFRVSNANSSTDHVSFSCVYKLGNKTETTFKNIEVIQGPADLPPNPHLSMSINGDKCHVPNGDNELVFGKNITLQCYVTLRDEHDLKLDWYLNGKQIKPMPRPERVKISSKINMVSQLTIVSKKQGSSGNYTCRVMNHGGIKNFVSTVITVSNETGKCFLKNVEFNSEDGVCASERKDCFPICSTAGKSVNFTMYAGDHPVYWKTADGKIMSSEDETPSRFNFGAATVCQKSKIFSMNSVTLEDQGLYTFYCDEQLHMNITQSRTGNNLMERVVFEGDNQVKLCLKVTQDPAVTLSVVNHTYQHFVSNRSYNFRCDIASNPLPDKVRWNICDTKENDCNIKTFWLKNKLPSFMLKPGGRDFETESVLSWTTGDETRIISCEACTAAKANCSKSLAIRIQTLDYFPPKSKLLGVCKDLSGSSFCNEFEAAKKEDEVKKEEATRLITYETEAAPPIVFVLDKKDFDEKKFREIFNRTALTKSGIEKNFTTHRSFQMMWTSPKLTLADAGIFHIGKQKIILQVEKIFPPVQLPSNNMNGSTVIAPPDSGLFLALDCSVDGIPDPKISWFKDDLPLNRSSSDRKISWSDNGTKIALNIFEEADVGKYSCLASNLAGNKTFFTDVRLEVLSYSPLSCKDKVVCSLMVAVLIALAMFAILLFLLFYLYRRQKLAREHEVEVFLRGNPSLINDNLPLDEQATLLPYNTDMEFPRNRLKLGMQIGCGAFGRVYKAEAVGICPSDDVLTVAVKMANSPMDRDHLSALMAEIKIMLYIGKHLNVVNLLGACTGNLKTKHELLAIVEYCPFGNIQQFLIKNRNNFVNQVDAKTGLYDRNLPNKRESAARTSFNKSINKPSSSVRYAKLCLSVGEENEEEVSRSLLDAGINDVTCCLLDRSNTDKDVECNEISHTCNVVPQTTAATTTTAITVDRYKKCSVMSNDSQFENVENRTGVTEIYNNEGSRPGTSTKRRHKISIMSTDSQFDNVVNNTDMTEIDNQDFETEERKTFSTKDLLSWGYQIAKGMEYLASKRVIHGDLAARNVLLAENNVIKICDFGLAKNMYSQNYYRKKSGVPLPIKWMALEALTDQIFSTQTDVWSYGIVLWEIFSLGRTPYPGEPTENFQSKIASGLRMSKPYYSPEDLYRVMSDCWHADPKMRPSFSDLADKLGETLMEGDKEHYFQLSLPYELENEELQKKYVCLLNGNQLSQSPNQDQNASQLTVRELIDNTDTLSNRGWTEMMPLVDTNMQKSVTQNIDNSPQLTQNTEKTSIMTQNIEKCRSSMQTTSFFNPSYEQTFNDKNRRTSLGCCSKVPESRPEFPGKHFAAISEIDLRGQNHPTFQCQNHATSSEHRNNGDVAANERPNSSASSRSSGFHSAVEDGTCQQSAVKTVKMSEIPRPQVNRLGRKTGLRSSIELRLTCQEVEQAAVGRDQGVAVVAQPTPPPSYESAVRDRRFFSFSSIISNHQH